MSVLFCSRHPLERAENIFALYQEYSGEKTFKQGIEHVVTVDEEDYSIVVYDEINCAGQKHQIKNPMLPNRVQKAISALTGSPPGCGYGLLCHFFLLCPQR